jgi:DNA-binding Lrp family transcriptional regulator
MVRRTRSDAERDVIRALTEDGCRTTAELAEVVDVTKQQIRNITEKLEEEGLVSREKAGRAYNYAPTAAVCDASDLADVDLADVDLEVVEEDENRPSEAAVNPNSTYIVHTCFLGVRDNSDGAKRREEVVGSSAASNGTVEEVVGPPDGT